MENNDTVINNIFPFFAYFSKTIDFGTVLGAEMNLHAKIP